MFDTGISKKIKINFNDNFTADYLAQAPLALALERAFECHILSQQEFVGPVLDIGCGDGILASVLFKEPIDCGLDPDKKELQRAKAAGSYKELICAQAQEIPKPDSSFQTILANSVLEHIPGLKEVLKEAGRVLAAEGRMYITVPTEKFERFTLGYQILSKINLAWARRFGNFYNHFWKHHHCYDAAGWQKVFAECGWKVVQQREYDPKRTCMIFDLLVPLSLPSFFSRKFLNRWFLSPSLRRGYTPLLIGAFGPLVKKHLPDTQEGGLVFFELRKVKDEKSF